MAQHFKDLGMNKALKNKVVRYLQDASKTYEAIADKQREAGLSKAASVTTVRKVQVDSLIAEVKATIEESPHKPKAKKKAVKNV